MEMMNTMIQSDSCRNIMGQKMVAKSEMEGMMKDPTKMKATMDHLVIIAANDSIMFNDMIQMTKVKPEK